MTIDLQILANFNKEDRPHKKEKTEIFFDKKDS